MSEYRKGFETGISAGMTFERKRIMSLILGEAAPYFAGYKGRDAVISLIKGDPLRELQQLADETGERENFENPLIKGEKE